MSQLFQIVAGLRDHQELMVVTVTGSGAGSGVRPSFGSAGGEGRRGGARRGVMLGSGLGKAASLAVGIERGVIGIAVVVGEADGVG